VSAADPPDAVARRDMRPRREEASTANRSRVIRADASFRQPRCRALSKFRGKSRSDAGALVLALHDACGVRAAVTWRVRNAIGARLQWWSKHCRMGISWI